MTGSVLVVGGVSWDTIVRLDRLPEGRPQTAFAKGARETVGSTGAGKAMNLARLGLPTTLHALLGEDDPGSRAQAALREVWCDLHDWDGRNAFHSDFVEAADRIFLSADALEDPRATMERIVAAGKRLVVCTFGRDGALALTGEGRWMRIPAVPGVAAVDTNGAGDAFFAGALFGHVRGYPVERQLRAGAVVAAWCVRSTELAHPELSASRVEADLEALDE